ncbi:hypothetical protein CLTEP_07020 [Clostridium tepidiprofundi DSM 19306]|uniref:Uncharacterized protein n=1 Tax=Clostridium tepidiprofundi DSM 19306 TaxID=1121338 RepID=A0A151B5U5_9CLOT|nr:hypothetical protein [Clostridium tepidiprofundi]KYH35298.1 hypothetical protein CLTEP_07020 [Clostridium tepidiprofundi DSM 19306]
MEKRNIILGFIIIIVVTFICGFTPWGSFKSEINVFGTMTFSLTLNGFNGSITFMHIKLPNYIIMLLLSLASIIAILNIKKVISIPAIIIYVLFGISLLWIIAGIFIFATKGTVEIGIILMLLCNIFGIILLTKSMSFSKIS